MAALAASSAGLPLSRQNLMGAGRKGVQIFHRPFNLRSFVPSLFFLPAAVPSGT